MATVQITTAFTMTEAARKLGVSRMTLWRAIRDGKIPTHKVGNATMIASGDLLDYVLTYRRGEGVPGA